MLERDTLKKMIAEARQAAEHEDAADRKYMALACEAKDQANRHRVEASALTQLFELWYPGEKPVPF